jgi:hypothetical protein
MNSQSQPLPVTRLINVIKSTLTIPYHCAQNTKKMNFCQNTWAINTHKRTFVKTAEQLSNTYMVFKMQHSVLIFLILYL